MTKDPIPARRGRGNRCAALAAALALALASSTAACVATRTVPGAAPRPVATPTIQLRGHSGIGLPHGFAAGGLGASAGVTAPVVVTGTATPTATVTLTPTATTTPTFTAAAPTTVTTPTSTAAPTDGPSPTAAADAAAHQPAGAPARASGVGAPTGARLRIPAIGVDAAIESVGKTAGGDMAVPRDPNNVGWYAPGARWGEPGNVAIAGHLDNRDSSPSTFWRLRELHAGDEIYIDDPDGRIIKYLVDSLNVFMVLEAPRQRLFGDTGDHNLNLITCHGHWDRSLGTYGQRLAAYAHLADVRQGP